MSRMAAVTTHRQPLEYLGGVRRFAVAEDKVPWSADYPEYQPVDYTAPRVLAGPVWADPDIRSVTPQHTGMQLGISIALSIHVGLYTCAVRV